MTAENITGFENLPQTLPHFCLESFRRHDKPDALGYKVENAWKYLAGREAIEKIKNLALGLASLGVKAGDKIIKLAGRDIKNISDYVFVLGEMKAGTEYEIVVMRGAEKLTLKITPDARK